MDPQDYTDEMLNRRFALVLYKNHKDPSMGAFTDDVEQLKLYRCREGRGGIPGEFTLREARDGLPPDGYGVRYGRSGSFPKSKLEKLRRAKLGSKPIRMNSGHVWNGLWIVRIDTDSENAMKAEVKHKAAKLKEIQAEINEKVGELLKQERALQKELRELRKQMNKV